MTQYAGLDLEALENAFKDGVKLFLYSNPNNPTGVTYSPEEVAAIGRLAKQYGVAVIADELYSRQLFDKNLPYTHLRALPEKPDTLITIIGPSKTESLSGFRLGVAYGSAEIISRMENCRQSFLSAQRVIARVHILTGLMNRKAGWKEE